MASRKLEETALLASVDVEPMIDNETFRPRKVCFFKMKLSGDANGNIDLRYTGARTYQLPQGTNIEAILGSVIDSGTLPNGLAWKAPRVTAGGKSPLSIRNNEESYIGIVLDSFMSGNYEFSRTEDPFRVKANKLGYYFEPRCAYRQDGGVVLSRKLPANKRTRVALFKANSDDDLANSGGQNFTSDFNIYLDLTFGNQVIPITVDPDVGHPGGNEEDP